MKQHLWTILFSIVFVFYFLREHHYTLIYYTVWTFLLEIAYFVCKSLQWMDTANTIWPYLFAPAIVVCMGFWIIIAPMQFVKQPPGNMVLIFVTHGLNMVAVLVEKKHVYTQDIWKPIAYTAVYNIFLAVYVGGGGRNINGGLPYWYAQYDKPIGWIFAALAIASTAIVHFIMAVQKPQKVSRQCIV